jgi:hypothetical protein
MIAGLTIPPARRRCQAFTLMEMVISGAVAALILAAAYLCLNAALAGQKLVEPRAEAIQNARVAMALMTADLRAACPLSKDFEFLGMARTIGDLQADNIDFATHHHTPQRANQGDYCQMSYFVGKEPGTGDISLFRRRNPVIAIDPLSGGSTELVVSGLRGLRFEYFDGYDWYESWGETDPKKKDRKSVQIAPNLSGLPEAVRITVWMNPNPVKQPRADASKPAATPDEEPRSEPPLVFQTVVRLNLAGATSQNGLSDGSTTGTDSPDAQQNPASGVINN